jgi:DNA-binding response OmpR family regulator
VLVVDDDAEVRSTVVRLVELEGFRASEATTSSEVFRAIDGDTVDMVLLDVTLETEDGFEILAGIRRGSDLPIILLTARTGEIDRVHGLRLGADDYVAKPFSGARCGSTKRWSKPRSRSSTSFPFWPPHPARSSPANSS